MSSMRTMTAEEIDGFLAGNGFGVLALAEENHAYGVPLFYGTRHQALYFQTRAGRKTHYLYATTEACLTVSAARDAEWASVQVFGRLERVPQEADAQRALEGVPRPLLWAEDDERSRGAQADGVTTFRLVPSRRVGRYSQPADT